MTDVWVSDKLDVAALPKGSKTFGRVGIFNQATGKKIHIPVIAIRGKEDGPTVGIVAALHGNELNGVQVTHTLAEMVKAETLSGNLILIPILNIPGFETNQRTFLDGIDLNRIMPGMKKGAPSEIYAYRIFHRIILQFDYLLDLHTASYGRVNSYYIRANIQDAKVRELVGLLNADIIVHKKLPVNSLRNAAMAQGITAITLELGNPLSFQEKMIDKGIMGIINILKFLKIVPGTCEIHESSTTICSKSYWIRTVEGGIIDIHPQLTQVVKKGEKIADLYNLHGQHIKSYYAPETGIIIGKSINPVTFTGGRVIHLGIITELEIFDQGEEDDEEDIYDDEYHDF
ncbi:MAG: succinylglutamate desuccinylase/aspartoacylase family protein [Candidatus Heimdallarchaeota archaeon]|nr:succinylglutamate desuccinylase/aspartoacylase family protein [Candidatus Heimdallarchaeota archaeon]